MRHTLLVELLTEELPPRALSTLAWAFTRALHDGLREAAFLAPDAAAPDGILATPRRLAALVHGVLAAQPERSIERKGPYVAQGLDPAAARDSLSAPPGPASRSSNTCRRSSRRR
jgi:glycyl-tRNA synthetase beta chain